MDGTSIWAGDGVHLTSNASRVASRKLMADLVRGGEECEPATKRTRLHLPRKRSRHQGSRRRRRPDPACRHRRSGSLGSYRRPSEGVDPDTKPYPEGGRTGAWQRVRRQPWCQPWCQPWIERAAQRRPVRPLGQLVESLKPYTQKETE